MEKTGGKFYFLGRVFEANGTRILGGSKSEVHPKRDKFLLV